MNKKGFILIESLLIIIVLGIILTSVSMFSKQFMPRLNQEKEQIKKYLESINDMEDCNQSCLIKKVLPQSNS